jgi:ankyrin repeat protein
MLIDDFIKAVIRNDLIRVKHHILSGFDMATRTKKGRTVLEIAAKKGHVELCALFIGMDADLNAQDLDGYTPLHEAAWHDHLQVAEFLISQGAEINARAHDNDTPLHLAARRHSESMIRLLISNSADRDAKGYNIMTPLDWAAGHCNRKVVELMITAKNINSYDGIGSTPLLSAAFHGAFANVKTLIKKGADPCAAALTDGFTALHLANSKIMVEYLLSYGLNVNARTPESLYTPLHHAAAKCRPSVVQALLAHGADANAKTNFELTALHYVANSRITRGCRQVIKILTAGGADLNSLDARGRTPLNLALLASNKIAEDTLRSLGAEDL